MRKKENSKRKNVRTIPLLLLWALPVHEGSLVISEIGAKRTSANVWVAAHKAVLLTGVAAGAADWVLLFENWRRRRRDCRCGRPTTFTAGARIKSDWLWRYTAARAFARAASIFAKARRSSACAARSSCCAWLASAAAFFLSSRAARRAFTASSSAHLFSTPLAHDVDISAAPGSEAKKLSQAAIVSRSSASTRCDSSRAWRRALRSASQRCYSVSRRGMAPVAPGAAAALASSALVGVGAGGERGSPRGRRSP